MQLGAEQSCGDWGPFNQDTFQYSPVQGQASRSKATRPDLQDKGSDKG